MRETPTTLPRLDGRTIVVTGSRRAVEQSALVSNLGGSPYVVPTVGISIPATDSEVEPFLRELASPGRMDYAVFMTATGVRTMMLSAERLGLKDLVLNSLSGSKTTVVARGGKPRGELAKQAIKVDASPPREKATASGIVELLKATGLKGAAVAIVWHGSRDGSMVTAIREAGAREVWECLTYRYARGLGPKEAGFLGSMGFKYQAPEEGGILRLIEDLATGRRRIDAVTFTSPPAVSNLFEVAAENGLEERLLTGLRDSKVAAVGPSTKRELEEYGVRVDVVPDVPAMGAMMGALAAYMSRGR